MKQEKTKKNKILKTIIKCIKVPLYIFVWLLIVFNGILLIQKIINPNENPSVLGYQIFSVKSGSMTPAINIGDMIVVHKTPLEELCVGDVISYKSGNSFITHRIVEKKYGDQISYSTKGDYNNVKDKNDVLYENIEGKVIMVIPKLGNVFMILQNKNILLVLIIFSGILWYLKNDKEDKKVYE